MNHIRLLFASIHGYIDPSNGAATATRDLLELLAAAGMDCRVLSTGVLDYFQETSLEPILAELNVPVRHPDALLAGGGSVTVYDLELAGVRVTLMPTASSRYGRSPNPEESARLLDLAGQVFERFRPDVLLTYGGHPTNLALMAQARKRGIAVVFHLHNFAYMDPSPFVDVSVLLVYTEYSRRIYAKRLGLSPVMIPLPYQPTRVLASDRDPRYLTFVNPIADKGVTVFARIAAELGRRGSEIPLLVVGGRGPAETLARVGLDLSGLTNLHQMASTTDPRDFFRVSRALLVPSLWQENAALVAREAMANGIPILASDRGGLPETLGDSGFLFHIPAHCSPESGVVPTPTEVAPWVATIERLWNDPAWEAAQRTRTLEAAQRWAPERLVDVYRQFFARVTSGRTPSQEWIDSIQ